MAEQVKIELIDPLFSLNGTQEDMSSPAVMYFMDTDFILNKDIMTMVVEKYPMLNPNFLYGEYEIVTKIGNNSSFKLSSEVMDEIRRVFMDADFLCDICDNLECTFGDILNSFFSYFGDILFKRMYFYKWLFKAIGMYSPEQREWLEIDERICKLFSESAENGDGVENDTRDGITESDSCENA